MQSVPANRFEPNLIFFVNSALRGRLPLFADDNSAKIVSDSLQFFRRNKRILLYGFVIMPDHIHLLLRPVAPLTLPNFMRRFKNFVAHEIDQGSIWDKGYWSEVVVSEKMFWSRLKYLHLNPVRAGLVAEMCDYLWTSAREWSEDIPRLLTDEIG